MLPIKQRSKFSVTSLNLLPRLKVWIENNDPKVGKKLSEELNKIFRPDGLRELLLYLVEIDRIDLLKVTLETDDIALFYCSHELNECLNAARSEDMRRYLSNQLREYHEISYCDA